MTSYIEDIYSEYRSTYEFKPDFHISFYEKNSLFFDNIKEFKNKQELKYYIEIICKYVQAHEQLDHYSLVNELIEKFQYFIDCEIARLSANELKDEWYHEISFTKAIASYYLKDYSAAVLIFKNLVLEDNKNDRFKKWLAYSRYGQKTRLIRTIQIFCGIIIAIETIFGSSILKHGERQFLLITGFFGLLATIGYEQYVIYNFRGK